MQKGQTEHVSNRNNNKKEVESIPFVSYVFFPAVGGNFPNHLENKDEVADKTEIARKISFVLRDRGTVSCIAVSLKKNKNS